MFPTRILMALSLLLAISVGWANADEKPRNVLLICVDDLKPAIGCYGDPGLDAFRELIAIPIVGPGEATALVAASLGHRFSVITVTDSVVAFTERQIWNSGVGEKLASVRAVNIPVFGNGNVFDQNDCLKMIEATGCDGVAIGRMAIARPWLFAEWTDGYQSDSEIYLKSALRLAGLLETHFDHAQALRRLKKFGFYFSANFKFGHTLFSSLQRTATMPEAKECIHRFFELPPETVSRPNLNFFS